MYATASQSQGTMMGPLRGHMALNSSPFKPSINKLSSQYLIQDQMTSHYYNLATIKSAVDNKPPKSSSQSIKKRDQIRRQILLNKMKNEKSPRQVKNPYKDYQYEGRSTTPRNRNARHRQVSSKSSSSSSTDEDYEYTQYVLTERSKSGLTTRSWEPTSFDRPLTDKSVSRPATTGNLKATKKDSTLGKTSPRAPSGGKKNILNLTYSGDYLDRHENRFQNSNNALFTPRTKKRPGKSFLSQSKHYAPPTLNPKKKESKKTKSDKNEKVTTDNVKKLNKPHNDDDRSEDHRRWIEEQSEFVQRLSLVEEQEQARSHAKSRSVRSTSDLRDRYTSSRPSTGKSETRRKIEEEEEELKYLEFINDVTNDILSRGIYSDSVLHQMMERHVDRKKDELDVRRMRRMLEKLKIDLGISDNKPSTSTYRYNGERAQYKSTDGRFTRQLSGSSSHSDSHSITSVSLYEKVGVSSPAGSIQSISRGSSHSSIKPGKSVDHVSVSSHQSLDHNPSEDVESPLDGTVVATSEHKLEFKTEAAEDVESSTSKINENEIASETTTKNTDSSSQRSAEQHSSDESDYESVAALSMAIKPRDNDKEAAALDGTIKAEVERNVKVRNSDEKVTPDEGTPLVDEKASSETYSDDFQDESDDGF